MGLNVRVIKISPEAVKRAKILNDKIIFLTEGYENNIDTCQKKTVITFCPFCGADLNYLKLTDEYVQEYEDWDY